MRKLMEKEFLIIIQPVRCHMTWLLLNIFKLHISKIYKTDFMKFFIIKTKIFLF